MNPQFTVDGNDNINILINCQKPTHPINLLSTVLRKPLGLNTISSIYQERISKDDRPNIDAYRKVLEAFYNKIEVCPEQVATIPQDKGLLVVANHPLSGMDGVAIGSLVSQVRNDVKILMAQAFETIPLAASIGIFVTPLAGQQAIAEKQNSFRRAMRWLKDGHCVIVFPAGEVSSVYNRSFVDPIDVPWMSSVARWIKISQCVVLPVFVHGKPSNLYLNSRRLFHPLGSFFLLREIAIQQHRTIKLSVGMPLTCDETLPLLDKDRHGTVLTEFLRSRVYAAGQ